MDSTVKKNLKQSTMGGNNYPSRTFISTALQQSRAGSTTDITNSRIQNLPNYHRHDLGETIPFVIVFQTIEIERLSVEVETLRVQNGELSRALGRSENYEVQIRQLTDQCFISDKERGELREELDRQIAICENLCNENTQLTKKLGEIDFSLKQKYESVKKQNQELSVQLQKWKDRFHATERAKAKELEELRYLMESQQKSMLERELQSLTIRFQDDRVSLQKEIRKYKDSLHSKQSQLEEAKLKCQQSEIDLAEAKKKNQMEKEFQQRIVVMNQELLRLNQTLRNRENDIEQYKKRIYDLSLQMKEEQQWDSELGRLKEVLKNRSQEAEEWKTRAIRMESELSKTKDLTFYNNELTGKVEMNNRDIERLNAALKDKNRELDESKRKLTAKEAEDGSLKKSQNEIALYETRLLQIKAENERLQSTLKHRQEEKENWKRKYSELQISVVRLTQFESAKNMLEERCKAQLKQNEQQRMQLTKLQGQIVQAKRNDSKSKELEYKNESLLREIDNLNGVINGHSQQLNEFRIKYSKLENSMQSYQQLQQQQREQEKNKELHQQEKARLNELLADKKKDIETLEAEKLQMHTQLVQYRNKQIRNSDSEQILSKLKNTLEISKKDVENWQNKYWAGEARNKELENQSFVHRQEKERLNHQLRSLHQQYEDLKNRTSRAEQDVVKNTQLSTVCQQQYQQLVSFQEQVSRLAKKMLDSEANLSAEKRNSSDLKAKVLSIQSELKRVNRQMAEGSSKKLADFQQLQEHYSQLQLRVRSKDNQSQILYSKIRHLQSQCTFLNNLYTELLREVEQSKEETNVISSKINEYQSYAQKIQILGAQLDRLYEINRAADDDVRSLRAKYASIVENEKKQVQTNFLIVLLSVEIQSLRERVQQRELKMEDMRDIILSPVRMV